MNHVLGDVAAGKLPEQAPVDVFVGVEYWFGASVEEELPVDVLKCAVIRNGPDPLTAAARGVA